MKKIDLRKEFKHLYAASARKIEVVRVPKLKFVMVEGAMAAGDTPEKSREFREALGAVYGVSFTLKFMSKLRERNPIDYGVTALEGLWWVNSGDFDFTRKETWYWTLMMMQPRHITARMFREAVRQLQAKRPNPAIAQLRFESFREGLCVQTMHVGPYAKEPETIERMKAFAREKGYVYRGKHHEIYLGDPRRAKPEKLRTILRQPVVKGR